METQGTREHREKLVTRSSGAGVSLCTGWGTGCPCAPATACGSWAHSWGASPLNKKHVWEEPLRRQCQSLGRPKVGVTYQSHLCLD